jgi:HNH endonuclease
VKAIHPKSTERSEQVGIINAVPKDQTNQVVYLKGLFVTRNKTNTFVPIQIQKPLGFYKISCKRCRSTRTTKSGIVVNVYQRCNSCDKVLGVPSNAKSQGMSAKECTGCGKVNDVKYSQRWRCVDCRYLFSNASEWELKEQQQLDPLKAAKNTWLKIRKIIFERDDYMCQICGKTNGRLDVHHIIPRIDGGQDSMDNLITVCNGICHKKLEPVKKKLTLSITEGTFARIGNLVGNAGSYEGMIIRFCEKLEKAGTSY